MVGYSSEQTDESPCLCGTYIFVGEDREETKLKSTLCRMLELDKCFQGGGEVDSTCQETVL